VRSIPLDLPLDFVVLQTSSLPSRSVRIVTGVKRRWWLAAIALVAAGCGTGAQAIDEGQYAGVELDVPLVKPAIILQDTDGNEYDLRAETEGKLTLLYFGYTNCPDICPVHLAQLQTVLARPEMPPDVDVVFVTVDPDRDDPDSIRRFLDNFDDDFVGLTGTLEQIQDAQRAFNVPVAQQEGDGDDYTFGHAGQVFAFAPDGVAYTVYPQGTRQTHWVRDLPILSEIGAGDG